MEKDEQNCGNDGNLWNDMEISVGMMTFPIYGNIKFMFQTTNQGNIWNYTEIYGNKPSTWSQIYGNE